MNSCGGFGSPSPGVSCISAKALKPRWIRRNWGRTHTAVLGPPAIRTTSGSERKARVGGAISPNSDSARLAQPQRPRLSRLVWSSFVLTKLIQVKLFPDSANQGTGSIIGSLLLGLGIEVLAACI